MKIYKSIKSIVFIVIGLLILESCSQPIQYDLVLQNGQIIDGTGSATQQVDIAINADTIAFIGDLQTQNFKAKTSIDASDFTISPGFIDSHTHALNDLSDSLKKANLNYLLQGVTTVVAGNDGNSVLQIGDKLKEWNKNGIGTNAALMIGHRTIRQRVMSMRDDPPTAEEMTNMKTLVKRGMDDGALGFSTGLYYAPASFATTEEVIELAKVTAEKGGMYDAHIRDESSYTIGLLAAIEETIEIGKKADIPVNISHIKCLGVDVWNKSQAAIQLIENARKEGVKITADQYPYLASGTHLDRALLPKWVYADAEDYTDKFDDLALLPKIKEGITENLRRRGGAETILIVFAKDKAMQGKNLAQIAKTTGKDAIDTAIDIMKNGSAAIASFNMQDADVQNFMKQPWVMTCSDGTNNHPRKYGTFPKKMREYVFEKKTLTLEEMIRKSTSLSAETYGIKKRGKLKEGYFADLLIFQPEKIKDKATFENPAEYSEGMEWIVLNGKIVVEKGVFNKKLAGKAIQRQQ